MDGAIFFGLEVGIGCATECLKEEGIFCPSECIILVVHQLYKLSQEQINTYWEDHQGLEGQGHRKARYRLKRK